MKSIFGYSKCATGSGRFPCLSEEPKGNDSIEVTYEEGGEYETRLEAGMEALRRVASKWPWPTRRTWCSGQESIPWLRKKAEEDLRWIDKEKTTKRR